MSNPLKSVQRLINKGNSRTVKAKKNIIASFGIKGVGLAISFIKVPIILAYLDVEKYGVWLTIASIIDWVHYFDLGIGHGLRNKFAIALAKNDKEKAKKLVSTAYYYVSIIFICISLFAIPIIMNLNWQQILNTTAIDRKELMYSVLIVYLMFVTRFIFNLITNLLKADQRPAIADSFYPIGSIVTLIMIYFLGYFSKDSLFLACVAISVPPVLAIISANIIFFYKRYSDYKPSYQSVDKSLIREIFSLGLKFFFIQIAGLVMFSSANVILTQVVNPAEVSLYNIARQYYGLPFMFFGIVLSPFWSAITEAYTKNEFDWIKKAMKMLLLFSVVFCGGLLIMGIFSDFLIGIWLKGKVQIPISISISMVVLNLFYIFFAPFSHFINGVGKLNIGLRVVIIKTILFLPIAILLTYYFKATGLIISMIIVNSIPSSIIETIQYKKIINRRAHGIWNK